MDHLCILFLILSSSYIPWKARRNVSTTLLQVCRGLTAWLSSSDGGHVPGRWAKFDTDAKWKNNKVKRWKMEASERYIIIPSLTLCRAWPYQAAGLSEWRNQVVGSAARPALVWEYAQPWLHHSSWYMCIKSVLKDAISPFFHLRLYTQMAKPTEKTLRYGISCLPIMQIEK